MDETVDGFSEHDAIFMKGALEQAQIALEEGEVPVGCVVVRDGKIVGRGRNATNQTRNGTRHAELIATDGILLDNNGSIEAAAFPQCILYVTCEPCIMCAGALSLLGFKSVVYGCANDKFGGNGSIVNVHETGCGTCTGQEKSMGVTYNSRGGLFGEEAIKLLQDFYIMGNPNAPKPHRPLKGSRLLKSEMGKLG